MMMPVDYYNFLLSVFQACVMKSTVINTSKEMMCYSDYPIPSDFAIFMHNKSVDKYLNMYADNFGLRQYIQLNVEVRRPTDNLTTPTADPVVSVSVKHSGQSLLE